MAKAILFDLDGTLLPVDTDQFVEHYMMAIVPYIKDYIDPNKFLKILWDSTHEMMKNTDGNLTNEEVFTKHFLAKTGFNKEDIWPVFDRFYEEHFPSLVRHTKPTELAKEIIHTAKNQDRKIVIATNPVFPKTAIYERLNWLGLVEFPFDMVTVYEESHFCKPHSHYFNEILDHLGMKAEDTIMVGNDIQEDMVASKLGMETFLVTDYVINRGEPTYQISQEGTLSELKEQINSKVGIFSL